MIEKIIQKVDEDIQTPKHEHTVILKGKCSDLASEFITHKYLIQGFKEVYCLSYPTGIIGITLIR